MFRAPEPVDDDVGDDGEQRDDADDRRHEGQAPEGAVDDRPTSVAPMTGRARWDRPGGDGHRQPPVAMPTPSPATRRTSNRAMMLRVIVMIRRTNPRAISAEVWRPTDASLNVVAICDEIVWPWSNRRVGICGLVADDHRHGHRLAERPAQAQDDRPDDPRAGERQDRPW